MESLCGPEDKHREPKVDDDYRKVILYRLASKDTQIAEAAFEAASTCVSGVNFVSGVTCRTEPDVDLPAG